MISTISRPEIEGEREGELGGQMSFLEHLEELRRRIIYSIAFVFVSFIFCWFVSDHIYNFLAIPIRQALAEAQERQLPLGGLTGGEKILPLDSLKEGDVGRYVFAETTRLGTSVIPAGTAVQARVARDAKGQIGLFTDEPIIAGATVIPRGVRLPIELDARSLPGIDDKLIVTTAMEPFSLYVKVSLYAAICLSVPFILWQIWAFVSPGLYPHERAYALPFILLSTISFVIGAAFAYYVIFPPAATYLLGLGQDFRLLLRATDYFDFIILVMLGMGVIFQMPAITYVLARIGLVSAGLLVRIWRPALIVILIAAAVLSPTNDVPNMMLFAAPMILLYIVSIFVAWLFGKKRTTE
ncbi:twin-arginine translocase subunit TatC [Pyrinomonas methylaliphatogenes]|uniref:Sec-independent protein translocase protein TatC n=1 Tax=Pyrinomonas methylaliphatogenes TaxID=454194 RepID=A0A0B6X045_9BACT|nr:twin-arginine translocase subunit TatC [Pyrinomonas methylaliphatogenes]CDM66696.1 twin arginine targeting protein translocase subunit TatC [Pyrinomonas methylaliphatogenes]